MKAGNLLMTFVYFLRNWRYQQLFLILKKYSRGSVLDIGGGNFFSTVKQRKDIVFTSWTTVDPSEQENLIEDKRYTFIQSDNTKDLTTDFDTILSIQALEHVFRPIDMVREISRLLKKDGRVILLVPQTSVLHSLPHHYYNFTIYWLRQALNEAGLEIVEHYPLGGLWSSMASHLFYFFFKALKIDYYTNSEFKRNFAYYLLLPVMILYSLLSIPVCLFLSLGDLKEEANNHLVVAKKA